MMSQTEQLKPCAKPKGSVDLWLDAAFDLLIEGGVEAVKVMPLAKRLGLTRTGFYHHFDGREALLEALIARWEAKNTGNLVTQTQAYSETITEAMLNLQDCWLDTGLFDAKLDHAIRNWARHDVQLQPRVDAADATRKAAIQAMFERFGYPAEDAQIRTMAILYTQVGYISMEVTEDTKLRVARIPAYIKLFAGHAPTERELARFRARHGMRP
ncbi:TetR/AcrR family transcriptional regulator [Aliiroseovarius lamellibrachiae]|uniref:TetR/AcrR family transcriptional regulator n=1 Tax=Aliiroseovarius lamellibrachiae TaxID=1924933 RepID=UPI0031B7F4FF